MEAFVRSGGRRGATRELALELSGVDEASAAQVLALRALNGCEGMKALSVFGRVDPYALILSRAWQVRSSSTPRQTFH